MRLHRITRATPMSMPSHSARSALSPRATALLERTHKQHPTDRDILVALTTFERDSGNFAMALTHARELAVLEPGNPQIRQLVEDLRRRLER